MPRSEDRTAVSGGSFPEEVFFECTVCADCCRDSKNHKRRIIFTESEAREISKISGKEVCEFSRKSGRKDAYSRRMKKVSGACFFLNPEDRLCRIYEKRPLVCRFYPFELKGDGTWGVAKGEECEGLGRGKIVPKKHFEGLVERARTVFGENEKNKGKQRSRRNQRKGLKGSQVAFQSAPPIAERA